MGRRRTSVIIVLIAFSLIGALVFAAVNADGREISRASSNDGGAWLLNRELAVVGHKNRAAGELSTFIRIPDSAQADVHQAGDLVVVHDPVTNRLIEVDTRAFNDDLEPTVLPAAATVYAVSDAVVVVTEDPLSVWRVPAIELTTLQDLTAQRPLLSSAASGTAAVRTDGTIVTLDHETMALTWHYATGLVSTAIPTGIDPDAEIVEATIVDDTAVFLLGSGDLVLTGPEEVEATLVWAEIAGDRAALERLQQPSGTSRGIEGEPAMSIAGISESGELLSVTVENETATVALRGVLAGTKPLRPIAHDDCIFAVVVEPAIMGAACDEFVERELSGAGTELRLRLVNGWVWVNDLDDGGTWVTNDALRIESLNDWARAAPTQQDEPELREDEGGDAAASPDSVIVENPDAVGEVKDSDDYNPGEENVPPVAIEDSSRTRVDRAVVVDVLANDTDANNDILVITDVRLTAGDASVTTTASLQEVQVTPGPGFLGTVQFNYSISDGRSDPVTTSVVVDVLSNELANRAPEPVTDVVATAPGNATTIDVLRNDVDPDGDALALVLITADDGTLRWDPSGQVTYTPDTTTSAGWIELPYIVADDLGAEASGLLRVEIRDLGSNQEPDARNDQAATVASRPVAIDLLLNDSDPDGDPLFVSSRPRLLSPENAEVRTSTTADGEFIFEADEPGTYLFEYTINDGAEGGSESDTARIRVDVAPADENDPPVAVRDDVVLAVGETRTVYVLDNDGDPDGDVISIVDWSSSPGLLIAEFNDGTGHVGFQITATPTARRPLFTYSISDGVNDPVTTSVVVSLVGQGTLDQPPFAIDDVVEMRAGSTVQAVDVLANDFDPEGGSLKIVRTGDVEDAVVLIAADGQSLAVTVPIGARTSFTVPYDIEDQGGNRAAATLRVQLINEDAPNRPPTARADEARTTEGDPIRIDVLRNDSDPDADAIALEGVIDQPRSGLARVTVDGAIQYQPDPDFTGTDIFRYAIVDSVGDRAIGEVFVGVMDRIGVNLPPIANDDSFVLAGTPTTTPLEVRANDFDPEGDPLRVVDVTPADVGSVAIDLFGRVEFIPPLRLAVPTTVTFDYVIADTAGNRARATVTIELDAYDEAIRPTPPPIVEAEPTPEPTPTPDPLEPIPTPTPTPEPTVEPELENEPPVAVNDERGPVPIGSDVEVRVLDNDFDPDGERSELSVVSVGEGARLSGSVVVFDDVQDTVQVEYTIADRAGAESSAVITVVVIENQAPVVTTLATETAFETPIELDLSGQALDADNDELFFICCEDRRNGEVSAVVAEPNLLTLVFTPASGFVGQAAFSYRVDDGQGHQTSGAVTVNVLAPNNRPPTVVNNTVRVPQGETVTVDLEDLSTDPDGDPISRRLLSEPGGDVSVTLDDGVNALVTTGRDAAIGVAGSFTYAASDGVLEAVGEVTIEIIEGENNPPEVLSTSLDLPAASSAVVDLAPLTIDNDLGDSLQLTLDAVSHDPLAVTLANGIMQISAPPDALGTQVAIGFTATDTRGETGQGTVTVQVVGPTQPEPAAIDDEAVANRGEAVLIDVVANDVDPLDAGLTIVSVDASWGNASIADEVVRFSPGDRVGTATIAYTIRDAAERLASARITVDTVGVPDKPAPPGVTADSRQVTIEWTNPAANGRDITGYLITRDDGAVERVGVQNSYIWTDLTNGDTYSFTVAAINEVGQSEPSESSLPATPNQVPETPAPPQAIFGDRQLTVSWTPPDNEGSDITGYELEIGPASAIEQIGASTEFVWQGLTNGQDYTFRVRAKNAAGFSPFSELSAPEHPAAAPEAPAIGATELGTLSGSLTVNWSKPIDNGDDIIEYKIRSSEGGINFADADATSFDWSDLPNGTVVDFQVQARNRAGWSDWSAPSVGIPPCGVPGAATAVTAVRGDGEVQLTWGDAAANGCPVTGYTIETSDGAIQNSATPGHLFTGLVNGVDYTFTVRATNIRGVGPASDASNSVTPAGPPLCPSGAALSASLNEPRQIDLNWTAAIDNGDPVDEYILDTGSTTFGTGSAATNWLVTGLANGTTYSFAYRAVNDVGPSDWCGSVSETTWDVPTPTGATLDFDATTNILTAVGVGGQTTDSTPKLGYTFTLDGGGGNPSNGTVSSPGGSPINKVAEFDILEDATYVVSVEACNRAGCVEGSASIDIVLATEPDEMTSSEVYLTSSSMVRVDGALGTSVFVDLVAPEDNGAPILEYEWEAERRQPGPDLDIGPFIEPISSPATTWFRIDHLAGYSDYRDSVNEGRDVTWELRVRAINQEGPGDWSDWFAITPPLPPATVTASEVARGCQGDDSCVTIDIQAYGMTPYYDYGDRDADVRSSSRSGPCSGRILSDASGEIFASNIDCNFAGPSDAPNNYRLDLDGVFSGNVN